MEIIEEEINQDILKYLRAAVGYMQTAVDELNSDELRAALSPEQKALNSLLRADALNREKRVQMNRQQRGGQTGQSMTQDVMTELQDLELNLSKDKYELQQQRQENQQKQEVDETLEKIKDLARRQQKLAEQMRKAQQDEQNERLVEQLRREQEQLQQEANELSREMGRSARSNQQISRQMQDRIDQAEENMRRASQEMRNNNMQRAMTQQREAANNLDQLQQDLQTSQADNMRTTLENFKERFEQFKEQEDQLARDLEQTYRDMQQTGDSRSAREDIERLKQKRDSMIDNTERLENLARAVEERAQNENPKIATDMRNFTRTLQREELREKMEDSRLAIDAGALQWAQWGESEIQLGIERLEADAKNLESEIPLTDSEKLTKNVQDIRNQLQRFADVMEQDQEQITDTQTGSGAQRIDNERQDTQQLSRGVVGREMRNSRAEQMRPG